ncbi:hypothetical protein MNEG_12798, partial [Monoraphidium neglectum]
MYHCVCGFSAATATAFHGHLTAGGDDASTAHRLSANNGRYSTRASAAGAGKANRPGGAYPPVEPAGGWLHSADSASELAQPQQQRRRPQQQRPAGGQQPAGGAAPAAAESAWDGAGAWVQEYVIGAAPSPAGAGASPPLAPLPVSTGARASAPPQAAPAVPAARQSFGAGLREAMQGYGWLSGAAGRAATQAVVAAVAAAAAAAADAAPAPEPPASNGKRQQQQQQQREQREQQEQQEQHQAEAIWPNGPLGWLGGANGDDVASDHEVPGSGSESGAHWGSGSPSPRGTPAGGGPSRRRSTRTSWRRSSGGGGGADEMGPRAEAVRALLLWHDFGASARALGFGLYLIMLLGSLPRGLHYLQITSVAPGCALLVLAYHLAKGPAAAGYAKVVGTPPSAARAALARA